MEPLVSEGGQTPSKRRGEKSLLVLCMRESKQVDGSFIFICATVEGLTAVCGVTLKQFPPKMFWNYS